MADDGQNNDGPSQNVTSMELNRLRAIELKHANPSITVQEIADQMGLARQTVSKYLNSRTAKELVESAKNKLKTFLEPSVDLYGLTIRNALIPNAKTETIALGQKSARDVMKNYGILVDQVDLNHNFPKPTIIKRLDGSTVVLGTEEDKDEGNS